MKYYKVADGVGVGTREPYLIAARDALAHGEKVIVLDFADVRTLDSGAAEMIDLLIDEAEDGGAVIVVDNVSVVAEALFQLLKLERHVFLRRA